MAQPWDVEAPLDVDMVSAACPACRILVVEANGQRDSRPRRAKNCPAAPSPTSPRWP